MDELNIQLRLGSFTIGEDWQKAIDKPKKYRDVFDEYGNCEAFIRISSKDLEVNVFEDEIIPLVKHICFGSIPTLIEGKSFVYRIFSFYGYIRLDPEGDQLLVSGDHLVKQRYPIVPFLKQMVRIGDLFIEFIQTLDTSTAEESQIVTHWVNTLKSDREEITAALDGVL